MDGRWYHLRDVVGGSVILAIAILTGSSSLFESTNVHGRQNRLRTVVGCLVRLNAWRRNLAVSPAFLPK